jgi:hypothetical protein
MSRRVSVYLNNEDLQLLDGVCKSHGCSQSSALKAALRSLRSEAPEPVLVVVPDRNVAAETVDEMINEVFP